MSFQRATKASLPQEEDEEEEEGEVRLIKSSGSRSRRRSWEEKKDGTSRKVSSASRRWEGEEREKVDTDSYIGRSVPTAPLRARRRIEKMCSHILKRQEGGQ
mmetsp:Transcript_38822/g.82502  ORF Transcript_38822/g.82502 Transcript_38822/m.82502 type:complete len:102 (-) Transcript_38822:1259-1564(-)